MVGIGNVRQAVKEAEIRAENPDAFEMPYGMPHDTAREIIDNRTANAVQDEIRTAKSTAPIPSERDEQEFRALQIAAENGMISPEEFAGYEADYNSRFAMPESTAAQEPQRASGVITASALQPAAAQQTPQGPRIPGVGNLGAKTRRIGREFEQATEQNQQRLASAQDAASQAITDQADLAELRSTEVAIAKERQSSQIDELQAESAQRQELAEQAIQEARRETESIRAEVRSGRLDPEAWARDDDGSTWEAKSIAALAMALGAMGQAFTGGENVAMRIIDSEIARNIDAQKESLRQNRLNLSDAEAAEGRLVTDKERSLQDDLRAQMQVNESWIRQIDRITAEFQGPEQAAALVEKRAQLEAQNAEAAQRMAQTKFSAGMQTLGAEQQNRALAIQSAAARAKSQQQRLPGLVGTPVSKKARDEAVEMAGTLESALNTLDALDAHVAETGFNVYLTDDDAKGKALSTELALTWKNLAELGVLAGPDMELIDRQIPSDPGAWNQGVVKQKLRQARATLGRKGTAYLGVRGLAMPGLGAPKRRGERL
ncbi:MAG: hypothetical protein AAF654_14815 [Myxococcota bacterium]